MGLLDGFWYFGLCSQQQLICVILLLFHKLTSLIGAAVSIQGLEKRSKESIKKMNYTDNVQ